MKYKEAMEYLQMVSSSGSKLGLASVTELLKRLNNPEDELKFIHVAGTNGKGSTSAFLTSILVEADYKVGRFISPTVIAYEESIQVTKKNTEESMTFITKEQVAKHISQIKLVCDQMVEDGFDQPTTFEIETAMAFLEFVEQRVDFVVLEVGLGGRLDATNVIKNVLCSVITSISKDHMQFLGNTLEEIAYEKAGIIRSGVPVVSYDQKEEVKGVLQKYCSKMESKLYMLHNREVTIQSMNIDGATFTYESEEPYYIPLLGKHQVYNAFVAMNVAYVMQEQGYSITEEHIRLGLANTKWFGRFSVLEREPYVIVDGAHNIDAAKMLCEAIQCYFKQKKGIFIIGVFKDKDYKEILKMTAPYASTIIAVTTHTDRALQSEELCQEARKVCQNVIDGQTVANALQIAKRMATKEDYILCFGSLSFLGDVYNEVV